MIEIVDEIYARAQNWSTVEYVQMAPPVRLHSKISSMYVSSTPSKGKDAAPPFDVAELQLYSSTQSCF